MKYLKDKFERKYWMHDLRLDCKEWTSSNRWYNHDVENKLLDKMPSRIRQEEYRMLMSKLIRL